MALAMTVVLVMAGCGNGSSTEIEAASPGPEAVASSDTPPPTDCATVPTTVPGRRFCDGYDPTPTPTPTSGGDDRCPDWARMSVTRPPGGWLGTDEAVATDGLWRSGLDDVDGGPLFQNFVDRAVAAAPPGFSLVTASVSANDVCVDESLVYGVVFEGPDDAYLGVSRMRLIGQVGWFEEGYPPSERATEPDGTELAWTDLSTVAKVWMASPDGMLVKITAFGSGADRRWGWPTTMATTAPADPTVPPSPLTIDADDLLSMARALAG
jgi:hypothetical protein